MQIRIGIIVLLASAALALAQLDQASLIKAQRDQEERLWARKSGLSATQIRDIRTASGVSDTTVAYKIRSLDAASLKTRNHILLVDTRNGCSRVTVLKPDAASFTEVWSLTNVPAAAWASSDSKPERPHICSQFGRSATAHVTPESQISVEIRVLSDPSMTIAPADTYLFEWTGATYEVLKKDRL